MKRVFGCVVLVTAICVVGIAPADDRIKSRVNIRFADYSFDTDFFTGDIKSRRKRCVKDRLVKLFRQVPGRDERVASTRENIGVSPQGPPWYAGWMIEREDPGSGRYYVKMKRKGNCTRDKSKVKTFNDDPGN
jgi:hypothetical protein